MSHDKKKNSGRAPVKPGPPLGLVIILAAAVGALAGSAGIYYLTRPATAPAQAATPAAGGTSAAPVITMSPPPAQPQYTPAPQPPGEPPPGKVWSVEHGHWHDAPATQITPVPAPTATPGVPPVQNK